MTVFRKNQLLLCASLNVTETTHTFLNFKNGGSIISISNQAEYINMQYIIIYRHDGMQHMSEPVFECMCEIVGTSHQLAIKREAMDIGDVLDRQVKSSSGIREMISGSVRERFRLKQSDVDCTGQTTIE